MTKQEQILFDINAIEDLRNNFISLTKSKTNAKETIDAYHEWYNKSRILFSRYFNNNKDFENFSSIDNNGNGYTLYNNYQKIIDKYHVIIDKLKRGDYCEQESSNTTIVPQYSSPKKRIFISHASKDSNIIDLFIDNIFLLGLNINKEVIAYTSRDDTGVKPGKNIPQFIHDNIECADVVLLMISDNFRNSEVCLNEMGAAWALNKYIVQILLPNTSFEKLGWLCTLDKAISINKKESIDSLCKEITKKLGMSIEIITLNKYKEVFFKKILTESISFPSIKDDDILDIEELGFLDYKEKVDIDVENVTNVCNDITNAIYKLHNNVNDNTSKLKQLNSINPNILHAKSIMKSVAGGMDELSIILETKTPILKSTFFSMIDNTTKMKLLAPTNDIENMQSEFNSINELIKSILDAKIGIAKFKCAVDVFPKAEKTFNKSKKRLSANIHNILFSLDECITKGQTLIKTIF